MAAKLKSLQLWCKRQCEGYRDVEITNLTSSWKSGLAFCAIIHRYRPDLIDYDSLSKENVYENNKLAFDVGHEQLDIPALLDAEDMVAMAVPDKLCIVTYLSQYYNTFSKMEPAGGPGIKQCRAPPKRASSSGPPSTAPEAKRLTPTKQLLSDQNGLVKRAPPDSSQNGQKMAAPTRKGTYGDTCSICHHKVYLMERHIEDGQLYHRRCLRDKQKSIRSPTRPKQGPSAFQWPQINGIHMKHETEQSSAKTATKIGNGTVQSKFAFEKKNTAVTSDSPVHKSTATGESSSKLLDTNTRTKQSQNTSSSLVTMLFGAASPYPGSAARAQNKSSEIQKDNARPGYSSQLTGISHKRKDPGNSDVIMAKAKPASIMERAAMFDSDTKPRFGTSTGEERAISGGIKKAPVTSARLPTSSQNSNSETAEIDIVKYTYHTGVASPALNPGASQPSSTGGVRSGLLQSLANIRHFKNEEDGKGGSSTQQNIAGPRTDLTDVKGTVTSFLGHRSVLSNVGHQTKEDGIGNSSAPKTCVAEGSQSADNKKSILKLSSPRQSVDGSCQKDSVPKTILKPRPNENATNFGVDDQPKPILKSRRSSDESEFDGASLVNPRPILKSSSPTEPGQLTSSSPPKSILKSRETSPEMGHKPAKSILKSKDSSDDMEVDEDGQIPESKPRSILKHSHETSSHARDELATSPIRSILKHAAARPDSRSILKSPISPPIEGINDANGSVCNDRLNSSLPAHNNRTNTETPVPAPRSQIKVCEKSLTPHPAPRTRANQDTEVFCTTKPQRPEHPPSLDKIQPGSKTDEITDQRSLPNDRSTPRSILKTTKGGVGVKPEVSRSHWVRQIPEATESAGTPSVSSSVANQSDKSSNKHVGLPINNFSAFNLNDSLLIHSRNDATTERKPTTSGDHPGTKSTWQMEMEARKRIHTPDVRSRAPPRPAMPTSQKHTNQTTSQVTVTNGNDENSGLTRDKLLETNKNQTAVTANRMWDVDLSATKQALGVSNKPGSGAVSSVVSGAAPPPRPPPPTRLENQPSNQNGQNTLSLRPANAHGSPTSTKGNLNRCPAFRIPDSPQSSPESKRHETVNQNANSHNAPSSGTGYPPTSAPTDSQLEINTQSNKRKILPDARFSFRSGDFDCLNPGSSTPSPRAACCSFNSHQEEPSYPGSDLSGHHQQHSPPKRMVNAEARIATLKIIRDLETLDNALQILEREGRSLEEKIRSVSDDDMDEDNLMVGWFEMINKKNDLVRKESDLMYRKRQQELEDQHMDLEYELRLLMEKPDNEKTASDHIRENALIQELLETVNQRNHIVDSMEEDRKRYIAEDEEIANMMAKTGLIGSGGGKKKKNEKRKQQKKADHREKEPAKCIIKDSENVLDKAARKDRKHFRLSIG
ncbi:hypothetical protein LSH36_165g03008 [Paralvinella palmiformis]|uniref:MICAL-like protein 1 n=1 Tax=Paralvinella palmiformis TaxID=53620 RepID=A0AAD9JT17_9ANNE|nr:hypothetical protein LSH36_165g03008 [Paralvinella palmiformis]